MNKILKIERAVKRCVIACVFMLIGATISRCETEKRVLRDQTVYVSTDFVYINYKNKTYKYERN